MLHAGCRAPGFTPQPLQRREIPAPTLPNTRFLRLVKVGLVQQVGTLEAPESGSLVNLRGVEALVHGPPSERHLDMELCDGGQGAVEQKDNGEMPLCLVNKHIYQPSHLPSLGSHLRASPWA